MTSPASRKSAERQRRKDSGWVRVEVWLDEDGQEDLRWAQDSEFYTQSQAVTRALRFYRNPS